VSVVLAAHHAQQQPAVMPGDDLPAHLRALRADGTPAIRLVEPEPAPVPPQPQRVVHQGRYDRKVPDWWIDEDEAAAQADGVLGYMRGVT